MRCAETPQRYAFARPLRIGRSARPLDGRGLFQVAGRCDPQCTAPRSQTRRGLGNLEPFVSVSANTARNAP